MPLKPLLIDKVVTVPVKAASTVEDLVEVPSNTTASAVTGTVLSLQLAASLQLLVVPSPSQVRVAARDRLNEAANKAAAKRIEKNRFVTWGIS